MKTLLLVLAAAVISAACAPVKQYQRGQLAREGMQLTGDPGESELQAHLFEAREGATGGYGSAGGGCGCN
jgi:hypothetical protein